MGAVLRARDPAMGREVALKCILSATLAGDQANEFRERFYREARAAGALAHPGIVPVFDVGEDEGVPFLVMELVQGRTLDAALKQGERYSLERVCEIGEQIADALGYAHRNGVIHRDIKPANILMTSREVYGAERPRITDFGVAKLTGGEATTTGQLLGTPAYMPPEQFTGAPIDGRTDLFALGVILYRMTTGEQPFAGETLTAVSYKVVHTEPIAPSRLNPAVPPQLEAVILKCLAKSPMMRYQKGEELAADLAVFRPAPRTSGMYPAMTQAAPPQTDAGETIDQVASIRPGTLPAAAIAPPPPSRTFTPGPESWSVPPRAIPPPGQANPAPPPAVVPIAPPQQARAFTAGASANTPAATPPRVQEPPAMPSSAPPRAPIPFTPPAPAKPPAPVQAMPSHTARPIPSPVVEKTFARSPHPDSTLPGRMVQPRVPVKASSGHSEDLPKEKKRGMSGLMWLLFLALALGGTLLFRQMHVQPTTPVPDAGQSAMTPSGAKGASSAAVDFDPKTLDPETNARLSLDLDALPPALAVTLQMDGKTYWTGVAGDHDSYQGLMVPPGQHTFRALVMAAGARKSSANVSGDFAAKKRMTLTIKLWPESNGVVFDPSSDVIATLERSIFPL